MRERPNEIHFRIFPRRSVLQWSLLVTVSTTIEHCIFVLSIEKYYVTCTAKYFKSVASSRSRSMTAIYVAIGHADRFADKRVTRVLNHKATIYGSTASRRFYL